MPGVRERRAVARAGVPQNVGCRAGPTRAQILASLLIPGMTLGKCPNLSEPQLPSL